MKTKLIITLIYTIILTGCATNRITCRTTEDPVRCQQQRAEQTTNTGIAAAVGALIGYALGRTVSGGGHRTVRSYRGYRHSH